jgi:8-oxo-dGTP diphosphatase
VIVEMDGGGIVLVRRRYPPLGWAMPGGFVEIGEALWQAAEREAREETGLEVTLGEQFFIYSDPARDARGHTIATVFLGRARGTPAGADDAAEARVFAPGALPSPLAFDHASILEDYFRYREHGVRPPPRR